MGGGGGFRDVVYVKYTLSIYIINMTDMIVFSFYF